MAELVITDSQNYMDIADAIRSKNGSSDTYTPREMAAAIEAIPQGGSVTQDQDGFIVLPSTGGGGGGGGDYSTAEVTIVSRHGIDTYFPRPIEANTWYQGQPPLIECIAQGLFSGVYTVVLYKGGLYTSLTSDYSFGVSGNITEINSGEYLITGDCTITET